MLDRLDGEAEAPDPLLAAVPAAVAPDSPKRDPTATLPPGTPLKKIPRREDQPVSGRKASLSHETVEVLLAEVRALRVVQEEILELLRARPDGFDSRPQGAGVEPSFATLDEVLDEPPAPPVRTRRHKRVLLIDDDPRTRDEAVAALELAQIPVSTASDGGAGLAAIAAEKPDVIVLEVDMRGAMGGKDVVNMIKATMEWVDVPLILYTRAAIASQKDARTIHGADEFVVKGPTGAETLVATIVSTFRRS